MPAPARRRSRFIEGRFEAVPERVAIYSPQGSEFDPRPLADWFATQGVTVALPTIVAEGQPLLFRRLGDVLEPDTVFGIHQPLAHEPIVHPDVIFVPLLAFDRTGGRLGQGKGFYDRTLAAQRLRRPPPLAIGLAFTDQQVERVPTGPFDQRLDGVLTETAYLDFTGDD